MIEIVMPRLSDSMEEGTILRWLVEDGGYVRRGEELLEIETDKAAMIHTSDADGTLEIIAPEGSTHPVGDVIGALYPGVADEDGTARPAADEQVPPEPDAETDGEGDATEVVAASVPAGGPSTPAARAGIDGTLVARVHGGGSEDPDGHPHASPVARRIATELGLDINTITGSGPNGRIVREDVERAAAGRTQQPGPTEAGDGPAALETAKGRVTVIEPTRAQQVIARRMAESRATVPDFTVEKDVDAGRLADLRAQLREVAADGEAPTVNDLVIKACALALRDEPQVNGAWRDGRFEQYERINVGIAVATEAGLVVPVVFDADKRDLHDIAAETRRLGARARSGEITPPELSGGTFSISNLGMFGVDRFTAIINPPQAAILAVGAIRELAVLEDGEATAGMVMTLALSVDHRAVHGAQAARYLAGVAERLAAPATLLG